MNVYFYDDNRAVNKMAFELSTNDLIYLFLSYTLLPKMVALL